MVKQKAKSSSARHLESTDQRMDKLLGLLLEHPMLVLSGAKIAAQMGVGRSAVWSWVERLRDLGVKVKGHTNSGYQLETIPDLLVPSLFRHRLRGTPFGKRVHHYFKTDSTNQRAMQMASDGEPHGTLVVAEEQTRGRGRLGRNWNSQKARGIYASIILRPNMSPAQAPLLTLAAGLAVRDAVADVSGLKPDLRWPNDVLLAEDKKRPKKICGILTEMQAETRQILHVVVGIGVNVNQARFPGELAKTATSLRLVTGETWQRTEVLVRLLVAFEGYYNQLVAGDSASIVRAFTKVSSFARGKKVKVSEAAGEFIGVTAGLDPTGCLLVKRDGTGKTAPVWAGDVREV